MDKQTVHCQTCFISTFRIYAFQAFIKAKHVDENFVMPDNGIWLCRWHGMEEFLKGQNSIYWYSEYYKQKARKYVKRFGKSRLFDELERLHKKSRNRTYPRQCGFHDVEYYGEKCPICSMEG